MTTLTTLLILPLAVARLSIMLVEEDGPFRLFYWLRGYALFEGVLSCVPCCSVWVSGTLLLYAMGPWRHALVDWVLATLALSMLAILVARLNAMWRKRDER